MAKGYFKLKLEMDFGRDVTEDQIVAFRAKLARMLEWPIVAEVLTNELNHEHVEEYEVQYNVKVSKTVFARNGDEAVRLVIDEGEGWEQFNESELISLARTSDMKVLWEA